MQSGTSIAEATVTKRQMQLQIEERTVRETFTVSDFKPLTPKKYDGDSIEVSLTRLRYDAGNSFGDIGLVFFHPSPKAGIVRWRGSFLNYRNHPHLKARVQRWVAFNEAKENAVDPGKDVRDGFKRFGLMDSKTTLGFSSLSRRAGFSDNGAFFVYVDDDFRTVRLIHLLKGARTQSFAVSLSAEASTLGKETPSEVSQLALSPDGKLLAVTVHQGRSRSNSHLIIWDTVTGARIAERRLTKMSQGFLLERSLQDLRFTADGKTLALLEASKLNLAKVSQVLAEKTIALREIDFDYLTSGFHALKFIPSQKPDGFVIGGLPYRGPEGLDSRTSEILIVDGLEQNIRAYTLTTEFPDGFDTQDSFVGLRDEKLMYLHWPDLGSPTFSAIKSRSLSPETVEQTSRTPQYFTDVADLNRSASNLSANAMWAADVSPGRTLRLRSLSDPKMPLTVAEIDLPPAKDDMAGFRHREVRVSPDGRHVIVNEGEEIWVYGI